MDLDRAWTDWARDLRSRNIKPTTITTYRTVVVQRFFRWLGPERSLDMLSLGVVREFSSFLLDQVSNNTANYYLTILKTWSTYLASEGYFQADPLAKLKRPPKRRPEIKHLPSQEQVRLMEHATKDGRLPLRDHAILLVFLDTGLRVAEVAGLKVSHFDATMGLLSFAHGKGSKPGATPLSPPTVRAIERYLNRGRQRTNKDALFLARDGVQLAPQSIRNMLKRVAKRAGITDRIHPHLFRHLYATESIRNGMGLEHLRRILRHSRTETTRGYLDLLTDDLQTAHAATSPVARWNMGRGGGGFGRRGA